MKYGRNALAMAVLLTGAALPAMAQDSVHRDGFEDPFDCAAEPGACVRILALGDTGEGNAGQLCVAQSMNAVCNAGGGCDAALLLGDNFYDEGVQGVTDVQWLTKFEQPYDQPALDGVPFFAVLGEHDYGPEIDGSAQAQVDYSFLPVGTGDGERPSDKWTMPNRYYDQVLGSDLLHLFALDVQDTTGGDPADQPDDMQQRVSQSTATWKLVMGHYPRFTSGGSKPDLDFQNALSEITAPPGIFALQEAVYCGADFYFSGHDHNLELIAPGIDPSCPGVAFLVSGAGSKVSGNYHETVPGQLFFFQEAEGFVQVLFTPDRALFEFYRVSDDCTQPLLLHQWQRARP